MNVEEWDSDKHLPILLEWIEADDRIAQVLGGGTLDDDKLDQAIPERGMVFNDAGEPVAVIGMDRYGGSFAAVHVHAPATDSLDVGRAKDLMRAFPLALTTAYEKGVRVAFAVIPVGNEAMQKIALHIGFKPLPYVQMIKVLDNRSG